jgi:hypothetical protein
MDNSYKEQLNRAVHRWQDWVNQPSPQAQSQSLAIDRSLSEERTQQQHLTTRRTMTLGV